MKVVMLKGLAVFLRFLLDLFLALMKPMTWVYLALKRLADWAELEYLLASVEQKIKAVRKP